MIKRRMVMTGTIAAVVATAAASEQSTDLRGEVVFEGGSAIPEGIVKVSLEGPDVRPDGQHDAYQTNVSSNGHLRAINFSLSGPADLLASSNLQIVARLERADGWLLARGSAKLVVGSTVEVTLNKVVY